MKKLLNYIVYSVLLFTVISCDFFDDKKASQISQESGIVNGLPDSTKKKADAQDVRMIEIENKVDTLTGQLISSKENYAQLKEKTEGMESSMGRWGYIALAAIVLSAFSIIISFISIIRSKGITKQQIGDQIKLALDESRRINKLKEDVDYLISQQKSNTHQQTNFSPQNVEIRIQQIESTLNQVVQFINNSAQQAQNRNTPVDNSTKDSEYHKVGYAKVDTENYFTTIYDSNQEGCVFKITFTSQSIGKFNIIALDKIQSRNDWQKKVECSGVSIKEALDFRLEEEGICEKIDEKTWKVIKPLKIRLFK